jgi:hypothetical protein
LTGVFYRFNVQLSTLGERHENFNNDSTINSILGLCMALLANYGQVSRSNIMDKFGWEKDRHNTWYNQWDYKTPRSYRERYGVDYKHDDTEHQEHITTNILTVILVLIIVGMLCLQN